MPKVSVSVPHDLTQEEVIQRLKDRESWLEEAFGDEVSDPQWEWDGNLVRFAFATYGVKVSGTVVAEPSELQVHVQLPLMAMMFKGTIETQIEDHLKKLLA